MVNITFKQLRYFEALTRHGHFGRAADACAISQPALSVQIKELEESLGIVLFERSARQVRLTGFGQDFAERARDILRAVDELGDLARLARDRMISRLRMGVIPTIAPYLLPTLIHQLHSEYSGLDVHIRETLTQKLIIELLDGRLDAAIVALPVSEPGLVETALFDEKFVLVRSAADAQAPVPSPEGLREMKLLLLEEGHCFRDQAVSFCNLRPSMPQAGLDGSSLSTLVQMVGAGIGVTIIPEMAIPVETRSAPVSLARFSGEEPGRTIGMVWRKTSPLAPQLRDIAEVVRRAAEALYAQHRYVLPA
ncbi:hydrogen peroxide-inducible genes activator [Phaeobacter sp. HF9A]|uniref:hydrogen peroxide-inducible genes activator n=1 Tax=Phaeobacter sp. HF9A TaxID=2721561 RepID=UPI001430962D|nr:hydrogen peroxide-inducible genes activator [Phaeobacter sp. HF9A]NIZ12531.1 LysR family transcriptional regulator [Phaeobacter sp. HF9A]